MGQDFRLHRHIIPLFWFKVLWRTILFFSGSHLGFSALCVCVFFCFCSIFYFVSYMCTFLTQGDIKSGSFLAFPPSLAYISELDRMAEGKLTEVIY